MSDVFLIIFHAKHEMTLAYMSNIEIALLAVGLLLQHKRQIIHLTMQCIQMAHVLEGISTRLNAKTFFKQVTYCLC